MKNHQSVSDLFHPEPIQWGLRGDPYLWREMATVFADTPLPASEAQLTEVLAQTFEQLVGQPVASPERSVFIERYSHGGMSSGSISFAFWRDSALPLMRLRFVEAIQAPAC